MKFIIACLMAGIVLPAAAQAQTCFYEPQAQKTTFYVGPQGQYPGRAQPNIGGGATFYSPQGQYEDQAPRTIGGYTYYGSQGQVQGQRRCRQDSVR